MNALRKLAKASPLAAAAVTLLIRTSSAQTCDYQITSADWYSHPNPDSIYLTFTANIVPSFPVSTDPLNPSVFYASIRIFFNGAPYAEQHDLTLRWSQGITCPTNCPGTAVCAEKEWSYKGGLVRRQTTCFRTTFDDCVCPAVSTPVLTKPVRKPGSPGEFEIEIIPLGLSCTPTNPQNDSRTFSYSAPNGNASAMRPAGTILLLASLALTGLFAIRRRALDTAG